MPKIGKEELQAEIEKRNSKSLEMYKEFIECYRKYVDWAKDSSKFVSESEVKAKINAKIREIQSLSGGKVSVWVNEKCYEYDCIPSSLKVTECSVEVYTAMLRLTMYIFLCRLKDNVKKNKDIVEKYPLSCVLNTFSPERNNGLTSDKPPTIILFVFNCLRSWFYTKKPLITHTVDHEFGHYSGYVQRCVAHVESMRLPGANRAVSCKLDLGPHGDEVFEKSKDILLQIEQHVGKMMQENIKKESQDIKEKKVVAFFRVMSINLKKCSQGAKSAIEFMNSSVHFYPEREALYQMRQKIVDLTGKPPEKGASKYVDEYPKIILDGAGDDLYSSTNMSWIRELYADARAKSKGSIYDEIKKKTGNKLKSSKDWDDFCKLAEYKGDDEKEKENAKLVLEYKKKLTKGRGVWGLAYRLLQLDHVVRSSDAMRREKQFSERVVDVLADRMKSFVCSCLKQVLNRVRQHDCIGDVLEDSTMWGWLERMSEVGERFRNVYLVHMGYTKWKL